MNKKVLIPIFFSILIGFLFGQVIFNNYEGLSVSAFNEKDKIYLLETKEGLDNKDYLTLKSFDNTKKTYFAITSSSTNANKIKELVNESYIDEKYIDDKEFMKQLKEYDKILKITTKKDDIFLVQKLIISLFKEMNVIVND